MVKAVTVMGLAAEVQEMKPDMARVSAEMRGPGTLVELREQAKEAVVVVEPGQQDRPQVPAVTDHPLT